MNANAWRVYLPLAALGALYSAVAPASATGTVIDLVVGASTVAAILLGVRWNRPRPAIAWTLFAVAGAALSLSAVMRDLPVGALGWDRWSVASDEATLLACVLVITALGIVTREVTPERDLAGLLDGGIVAFAMFSVLWVLVVERDLASPRLGDLVFVTRIAHPLLDVVLLAGIVRLGVGVRVRHQPTALLIAGLLELVAVDAFRAVTTVGSAHGIGSIEMLWMPGMVLIGASALHPHAAHPPEPDAMEPGWLTPRRFALVFVATLAVPLIDLAWGNANDRIVTATSSAILFSLVLIRVFWLMRAVTRTHERLEHVAFHDPLTGLANRALFADRVRHALSVRGHGGHTVLLVDLDDFKTVNDSLGHQAGDALLVSVADRLRGCTREADTVARLGGDEFALLLENSADSVDAVTVAQRILDSLAEPKRLGDHDFSVDASIGIAVATHEDDVDSLLRSADVAMYLAKDKGKGCFEFFESSMYDDATERLDLKAAMQRALENDQLEVYYQPIISMATQRLVSVEALLRWHHPDRGFIMPDRFIPLAEETGLIVPIGSWVFREACTKVREWQVDHPEYADLAVSVNLSVRQMRDPDLLDDITTALAESGLAPNRLTIEITESLLMGDTDRSLQLLDRLKSLGIKIAIDDFGTGYSSLSYLRDFPVDLLKIDRAFVSELGRTGTSEALVRSMLLLADAIGALAIAEGIEGFDQAEILSRLGCAFGQGFLISKPLPADEMQALLAFPLGHALFSISPTAAFAERTVPPPIEVGVPRA